MQQVFTPCAAVSQIKTKIAAFAAIFVGNKNHLGGLTQCPDAARAQNFLNLATFDHHRNLLEVGAEGAVGRMLRKAAVMAESRFLATVITNSHFSRPFTSVSALDQKAGQNICPDNS